MRYGYGRVSTNAQDVALQEDAFTRAGVEQVFTEKTSSTGARPRLRELLASLKPGDVVTVYKLDRLGRSLQDLLDILDKINDAGAKFVSLTETIDTATPTGKLTYCILGAVAEFEKSIIRERTVAGQAAARARGAAFGRPEVMSQEQRDRARAMRQQGCTYPQIAEELGVNPWNVKRAVRGHQYAPKHKQRT